MYAARSSYTTCILCRFWDGSGRNALIQLKSVTGKTVKTSRKNSTQYLEEHGQNFNVSFLVGL